MTGRDDSTGVAFLDTLIAIPAQSAVSISSAFASSRLGLHALSFTAVALGDVYEPATVGNRTTRVAEIVAFNSSPTVVSVQSPPGAPRVPSYLLTRAVPNPSQGSVLIEFLLPHAVGRVLVRVTDAAGRLVQSQEYGAFTPGWQRIAWELQGVRRHEPGVYFYRIDCDGMTG